MTAFGYTMMCEQSRPDQLIRDIQQAEGAGFDFSVISDHYFPWLEEQGHAGYAWSILGAAAYATSRIPLMTYVTCPILRYHPAIIAQKASTVQILSGGRFRLGLGAGENLNEHVVGKGWPAVGTRHAMFTEAVDIWFGLGWKVNADLPGPSSFEAATQFVTPEQVAGQLACGNDVDEFVERIKPYVQAGFTEIALVQIGAEQQAPFIQWAEKELLPKLRRL